MKQNPQKQVTLAAFACIYATVAHAATVDVNSGNPDGGAGYAFHVTLEAGQHTAPFIGTVGSWSWEDTRLGDGAGWRHQARWISVTLTTDAELKFSVERLDPVADAKLFPSFTVYQGMTDNDAVHLFDNTGDIDWTGNGTVDLFYIGHLNNSTEGRVSTTFGLTAGEYTIALGGNAISEDDPVNVNFTATLQAIPEPSSLIMIGCALLALLPHRKRNN